jgi:hypothetical protein
MEVRVDRCVMMQEDSHGLNARPSQKGYPRRWLLCNDTVLMGWPITILFLGANPSDRTRLFLGLEARTIHERLRASRHCDAFRIEQQWAVGSSDLQACLLRCAPAVVHFSGHGEPSGELLLEGELGSAEPVEAAALADLFRLLGGQVRCVVLNACYSEVQANAIVEHVDCVVGMSKGIDDQSAIAFAGAFYQALGYASCSSSCRAMFGATALAIEIVPYSSAPANSQRTRVRPALTAASPATAIAELRLL